ncbi:hypothetical protein C8J56DRAFT_1105227 [Mycena floridula]|nr:hypothetical protein C8J56DRAFT_1105227 [Mycena floridula]
MSDAECTANIKHYLRGAGEFIMMGALPMMTGVMFWTLYLVSVLLTVWVLLRKGFNKARVALLALIFVTFCLDTLALGLGVYSFFHLTQDKLLKGMFEGDALIKAQNPVALNGALSNIILLLMLIPGDCIVIWRAYAVWTGRRIIMIIPVLFLLGCIVNLPMFITCNIKHKDDPPHVFGPTACVATDASAWILSFCANFSATATIFYTAWCYHVSQRELSIIVPRSGAKIARVLRLLVESGFVYLVVMLLSITLLLWPIPSSYTTLSVMASIMCDMLTYCIAMVPTLTVLLVNLYGSFDEHGSITINASSPMTFASPRASGSYEAARRRAARKSDAEAKSIIELTDFTSLGSTQLSSTWNSNNTQQ